MLTRPISVIAKEIEEAAKETRRLIALREQRRADLNYKGCDFCFDVGCGQVGNDSWVPCPEHNGLCC